MKIHLLFIILPYVCGFQNSARTRTTIQLKSQNSDDDDSNIVDSRRSFLFRNVASSVAIAATFATIPKAAYAGIDPNALKALPSQGESGSSSILRQIEASKAPKYEEVEGEWETQPSGIITRDYRIGLGESAVKPGSRVAVEMTIRCQKLATANQPGGAMYYTTKADTEFNEYAWTIGNGELPPGLEEGMMGMKKGSIRRIELPSTMVFSARNDNQLPQPTTKDGKRLFERLFKTEATLMFEVLVTRVK